MREKKYRKLRGRVVESGYTLGTFAEAIGLTRTSLANKLYGRSMFTVIDIERACSVLNIQKDEIGNFFFPNDSP